MQSGIFRNLNIAEKHLTQAQRRVEDRIERGGKAKLSAESFNKNLQKSYKTHWR